MEAIAQSDAPAADEVRAGAPAQTWEAGLVMAIRGDVVAAAPADHVVASHPIDPESTDPVGGVGGFRVGAAGGW